MEEVIDNLTTTVLSTNQVQDQNSDNLEIIADVLGRAAQLIENNQSNISMEVVNTVSITTCIMMMTV